MPADHQPLLLQGTEPSASHPASGRLLKPLYLTDACHSHTQIPTNQSLSSYYQTPTRTRRAPSLHFFSSPSYLPPPPTTSLSRSVSSANFESFSTSTNSTNSNNMRRSTFNTKRARACSVSVPNRFIQDPQHPFPRSMSLSDSLQSHDDSLTRAYQHHNQSPINPSKTNLNQQFRSTIPYSKSNSIFIPPHTPHQHPLTPRQPSTTTTTTTTTKPNRPFCQSPSDIDASELDSLLASMIDCAKSFGIQDELNGIVDI